MAQVHAIGAVIALTVAVAFFVFALYCARSGRALGALATARKVLAAAIGLQTLLGLLLLARGSRPAEGLHYVYSAVALGAVPLARYFASEAPPKARAGTMAAGAVLTLIMIWRLWETGGA
ncbi:MAG: hypothetical protein ACRDKZ_06905 [Actinomycetota bacterium]